MASPNDDFEDRRDQLARLPSPILVACKAVTDFIKDSDMRYSPARLFTIDEASGKVVTKSLGTEPSLNRDNINALLTQTEPLRQSLLQLKDNIGPVPDSRDPFIS